MADEVFGEILRSGIKFRMTIVSSGGRNQKLPPMREKMVPDVLPSLFGLEVEIHSSSEEGDNKALVLSLRGTKQSSQYEEFLFVFLDRFILRDDGQKNPPCVIGNSRGILEDFYKISTQQYHTVRGGHDAKMIFGDGTYFEYMESAEDVKLFLPS